MPQSKRTIVAQVQERTRLDLRHLSALPSAARSILAGVVALVASIVADVILVALGKAAFNPTAFGPFHFSAYGPLTTLGVVGATIGWVILVRMSSQPRWVLVRAAVLVTVILLVPDVLLLPNNPTGGVLTLMVMHVAIAVITYWSLLLVAPAAGTVVDAPVLRRPARV